MKYFFLIFLSYGSTFASQMTLERTNHLGISRTDTLKHENGEYFFGDKSLGKSLPAKILASWNELESGLDNAPTPDICAAGKYIITKKDNKSERRFEGCIESQSYRRTMKNLESIRKYSRRM